MQLWQTLHEVLRSSIRSETGDSTCFNAKKEKLLRQRISQSRGALSNPTSVTALEPHPPVTALSNSCWPFISPGAQTTRVCLHAVFSLHAKDQAKALNVVVSPWRVVINSLHRAPAPAPMGDFMKRTGKTTTYHLLEYGRESPSTHYRMQNSKHL